jgi:hypothetical protein
MQDELAKHEAKKKRAITRQPIGRKAKIIFAICSLAGVWILKQTFLVLLLWMLPSIVIYITDRKPNRSQFQTVCMLNLAGIVFFVSDLLLKHNNDPVQLHDLMQDNVVWLTAYASAGVGYAIYYVAPYLALIAVRIVNKGRLMHIQSVQNNLIRDWGPIVAEYPKEQQQQTK